jgi:hypothetical protein
VLREMARLPGDGARGGRLPGLRRHRRADQLQRPGAPVLPARRRRAVGDLQVNLVDKHTAPQEPRDRAARCAAGARGDRPAPRRRRSRWSRCRPARRCCRPRGRGLRARRAGRRCAAKQVRSVRGHARHRRVDDTHRGDPRRAHRAARRPAKAALLRHPGASRAGAGTGARRRGRHAAARRHSQVRGAGAPGCRRAGRSGRAAEAAVRGRTATAQTGAALEIVRSVDGRASERVSITRTCCRWSTCSATWPAAQQGRQPALRHVRHAPGGSAASRHAGGPATLGEYWIIRRRRPLPPVRLKWDGEWQVTYETFRDMGIAYASA